MNDTKTSAMLEGLRAEVNIRPGGRNTRNYYKAIGYRTHAGGENVIARAYAIKSLFEQHKKHLYENDMIAGSFRGLLSTELEQEDAAAADTIVTQYGERSFWTNYDHFAPSYARFLSRGIAGTITDIDASLETWKEDADRVHFLTAARITMEAFGNMIRGYAAVARVKSAACADAEKARRFSEIAAVCEAVSSDAPKTFREALQLLWFCHMSFTYEGRYAMAFGRMDQYLYPFYAADIQAGRITHASARELVCCTLYKLREVWYFGGDDVCNIAIAGVRPEDGADAVNDLSYVILEAVGMCNIPGPNLSARLHGGISDTFIDACLQVIGQGIGYPALMNDDVNIPALHRMGYPIEDCRDYCMVGCIENFLQGKQPPWSDGRFNTPVYLEYAINNGRSLLDGAMRGVETGEPDTLDTMEKFIDAINTQMAYGAKNYVESFHAANTAPDRKLYQSPFLSCFCEDCIARGLDINNGGSIYPSVHGAGCMGIATLADSLAAIDRCVYQEKRLSLTELRDILRVNYEGHEDVRQMLLNAPKYGNGDPLPDRYAVWFVDQQAALFDQYRTPDGGRYYIAIASNTSNIPAGTEIGATPDGRRSGMPLSDAASPMHGMDKNGPTAVVLSCSKPDYTKVACGTVVNQKYSTGMFRDPEKRQKLAAMIKSYFALGGQEMQINSVSRDTLIDAQAHPEQYENLVVRVSGFSAYYTRLHKSVQDDILARTEHE